MGIIMIIEYKFISRFFPRSCFLEIRMITYMLMRTDIMCVERDLWPPSPSFHSARQTAFWFFGFGFFFVLSFISCLGLGITFLLLPLFPLPFTSSSYSSSSSSSSSYLPNSLIQTMRPKVLKGTPLSPSLRKGLTHSNGAA